MQYQQPSTVELDDNVEQQVFPDSDFRDNEPQLNPPQLWTDAVPVRLIGADDVATFTIPVPSIADVQTPILIVPRAGNNERKRVTFYTVTNLLYIAGDDAQLVLPSVVGFSAPVNTFRLPTNNFFFYESAAPLYALSGGGTGTFGYVSVLIELYQQQTVR